MGDLLKTGIYSAIAALCVLIGFSFVSLATAPKMTINDTDMSALWLLIPAAIQFIAAWLLLHSVDVLVGRTDL